MVGPKTSWDLVNDAAVGNTGARSLFLESYAMLVRTTLLARWKGSRLAQDVDDAVQEVWIECFKERGALARAGDGGAQKGFRAFLVGVVQNVARRRESKLANTRSDGEMPDLESPGTTLSAHFDRAWARSLVHEARQVMVQAAEKSGQEALRRVELLRMRFLEDLPIREIAKRWNEDAARLHHQYARAREDFRDALKAVIRRHDPGNEAHVERELLRTLQELRG